MKEEYDPLTDDLIERLQKRSERIRGYIKSSERVVELLAPEMVRFNERFGHDVYTARLSVDHSNGIREQTREADDLDEAADEITRLRAENDALLTANKQMLEQASLVYAENEALRVDAEQKHGARNEN